jgi:hypothetical protein
MIIRDRNSGHSSLSFSFHARIPYCMTSKQSTMHINTFALATTNNVTQILPMIVRDRDNCHQPLSNQDSQP